MGCVGRAARQHAKQYLGEMFKLRLLSGRQFVDEASERESGGERSRERACLGADASLFMSRPNLSSGLKQVTHN
jgi:hypothetical protein